MDELCASVQMELGYGHINNVHLHVIHRTNLVAKVPPALRLMGRLYALAQHQHRRAIPKLNAKSQIRAVQETTIVEKEPFAHPRCVQMTPLEPREPFAEFVLALKDLKAMP